MNQLKLPVYAKATTILFGLALITLTIYVGKAILLPLLFAAIFAILLNPIYNFLQKHRVPRILSIALTVVLGFSILLALIYFIYAQFSMFAEDLPRFKTGLMHSLNEIQSWLTSKFGISSQKQIAWVKETVSSGSTYVGQTLSTVTGVLVVLTLIPVYIFLLLLYRPLIIQFITQVFSSYEDAPDINEILVESKTVIQSYMVGLLIETGIVAILNSTALLIIGVDYAILLGILGALLNLIPYIGGVVAIAMPVLMALVTKNDFTYPLAVVGAYGLIQFIDNQFIVPKIVASKVKINALAAIVGVLIANALGGVAGMFLALPCIAILKIIFDRIDGLKPWGMLLGDEWVDEKNKKIVSGTTPSGPSLNRKTADAQEKNASKIKR